MTIMEDFEKPFILTVEFVEMLRGRVCYTEEVKALAELCIYSYRRGKLGWAYEPVEEDPGFPGWTAEFLDMLLRASHKQGRVAAGLEQHTRGTAPLHFVDLEVN